MLENHFREMYGFEPDEDWSSMTLVEVYRNPEDPEDRTLIGYIFVIDYGVDDPRWKLPGGHKQPGETPHGTALRETRGETGIDSITLNKFQYCGGRKCGGLNNPHRRCYFRAKLAESEVPWIHNRDEENEGEKPRFFPLADFPKMIMAVDTDEDKFLNVHYRQMVELGMIAEYSKL